MKQGMIRGNRITINNIGSKESTQKKKSKQMLGFCQTFSDWKKTKKDKYLKYGESPQL